MKTMKRVLALSLALALAISLMPNVLQVKASTDTEATSPVVVWEDSFEIGETFVSGDGDEIQYSTKDGQKLWNGAKPVNEAYFYDDWQAGEMSISGGVGDAWDGDSCIKIATKPDATADSGLYMEYRLFEVIKAGELTLEDGKIYVFSAWVKFDADTAQTARITAQNTGDAKNPWYQPSAKPTEWTKWEVPFTYEADKAGTFKFGLQMLKAAGAGAVYFDLIQITELVEATGISVEDVQVESGKQTQLKPTMTPANASTTVTWTSSNPSVATVDANGVVTALSRGQTTITATAAVKDYDFSNRVYKADKETYTDTCVVTVISDSPIVVWEDSFEVGENGTFTTDGVTNEVIDADGEDNWFGAAPKNHDYWQADMYKLTGTAKATGGVTGAWDGNSCIKFEATSDLLYMVYNLKTVITDGNLQLEDGKMYVLSVWVKYDVGTTYTSQLQIKNTTAVVDATGAEHPRVSGGANLTEWTKLEVPFKYTTDNKNLTINLNMQNINGTGAIYFDLLQITEKIDATANPVLEDAQVEAGEQVTLKPAMTPANASTTVTWSSSNKSVATVDANGVVTAVSAGTTTITATAAVKNYDFANRTYLADTATYTATCEVTVTDTFSIDSACINLGEDLDMKFFVNPADLPEGPEGFTATIRRTYADDREDDIKENVALSTYSDGWYYVSYSGIVAKEMGDKIYVTIYDSEGNAVSIEWEDSVAKLAYRAIEDCTESGATEELNAFVALLNYGAAAQNTFDYDKTNLVNANLSAGQQTVATYTGEDASVGGASAELRLNESIMLKSFFATDVLESATSVKVSFTNYRNQPVEYTVTAFGEDAADNGAYKYVPVTGLVIADVDTVVTITIENAEGTITVQDSMASYVARAKEAGDNDPLYDAIMALGAAAKTYLLNK